MIFDLPYERTFTNFLYARKARGEYKIGQSLTLYLDVDYLKLEGIYEVVRAHELTHLQITTSTTIGHALMFIAGAGVMNMPIFRDIFNALMKLSWESQEGAATLTAWCVNQARYPDSSINNYIQSHPEEYRDPFHIFNDTSQILLAPECYWMKPILANAMAQFCLNTDVISKIALGIRGQAKLGLSEYFNSTENHPQKRRLAIQHALGEPYSNKREEVCGRMYNELKTLAKRFEGKYPAFTQGRYYHLDKVNDLQRIEINDEINQTFLIFFNKLTSLPLAAYHSHEVGKQYDDLVKVAEEQIGRPLEHLRRFDMSQNLKLRSEFRPFVIDYASGDIIESPFDLSRL